MILLVLLSTVLHSQADAANIEGAASPDKKYAITQGQDDALSFADQKSGKQIAEILPGKGATVESVIAKWSPDGSKVALVVQHRRWNDVFLFERTSTGFHQVPFSAPDVFALYARKRPANHPESLKRLTNDDSVNGWISNSEVSMLTSFDTADSKNEDDIYTVSVSYILEVKDGKATVKKPELKVSP